MASLKKDQHLSQTFEGSIKNGKLSGFYTNLALVNKMVIGYVKIKGQYNRVKGDLKVEAIPGNLYWIVIIFCIISITVLTYEGIAKDKLMLIGSLLFLVFAFVITIIYLVESRSFIRQLNRISSLGNEENSK